MSKKFNLIFLLSLIVLIIAITLYLILPFESLFAAELGSVTPGINETLNK